MSSFDSNTKNIIVKPRKKRSLKNANGLDSLPEILKQELTSTTETKKTTLRLRKNNNSNSNNNSDNNNNNNNNNEQTTEKATSRKRSIRASSKAIVQRTEQNQADDLLEQATVAQTIEETPLEENIKKPRKKRKLKPQNNTIPNSALLSGDELALEGANETGLSVYLNTSSPQPTPVTLGTPQKKRRIASRFRTPSPPASRSQSPPSTPARLALASVLSDLDLSKHSILPDSSYVAHMRNSKEQTDSELNDDDGYSYNEEVEEEEEEEEEEESTPAILFDPFQTTEVEDGNESDSSSVYYDAMSDIEETEKITFTDTVYELVEQQ